MADMKRVRFEPADEYAGFACECGEELAVSEKQGEEWCKPFKQLHGDITIDCPSCRRSYAVNWSSDITVNVDQVDSMTGMPVVIDYAEGTY